MSTLTHTENEKLIWETYKDERFFRCSFKIIGLGYLSNFIDDIYKLNFQDIWNQYVSFTYYNKADIPIYEEEFYAYICKHHLLIDNEPREELLKLYTEGLEDIKEIEVRIENLEKQIAAEKQATPENYDRLEIYLLKYFIDINLNAKNQILEFLKNRIKNYIYEGISYRLITAFDYRIPYTYKWNKSKFEYQKPTILDNKFGNLLVQEYHELIKDYSNDPKLVFEKIKNYITTHEIISRIVSFFNKNHKLSKRGNILNEAIELYQTKKYYSFNQVIPLQLEGLFYDYCQELGLSDDDGRNYTFGNSLEFVHKNAKNFYDYNYYAFKLREFRNEAAHPKSVISIEDAENLSDILLLDLYEVCQFFFDANLPTNRKLNFLEKIKSKSFQIIDILNASDLLNVEGNIINIDEFYNYNETIIDFKEYFHEDALWQHLDSLFANNDFKSVKLFCPLLNTLSKKGIEEHRADEYLKQINILLSKEEK